MRIDYLYNPGGGHPAAQTEYNSAALEAAKQVKTKAGRLKKLGGYTGTTQFLQLHDIATTPADGVVPKWSQAIAGSWNFDADVSDLDFLNGIYACVSTTHMTKTLGAADTTFNIVSN